MSLTILLVLKSSTKVSESSDMTKFWATFCRSEAHKGNETNVLLTLELIYII